MGCASSKPLRQQAHAEGWMSPPPKSRRKARTFNSSDRSVDDYHRHLVALTSSSYGLLKVDAPKPAEGKGTNLVSLNHMYDKLMALEFAERAQKKPLKDEVCGIPATKRNSSQAERWEVPPADLVAVSEGPETIDVADMMRGLDEEPPRAPSPSIAAADPSLSTSAARRASTKASLSSCQPKKFGKATSFHTVEEVDARLRQPNGVAAVCKLSKDRLENASKNSPVFAGGHLRITESDGFFEKENAKPPGSENGNGREAVIASKTAMGLRNHFVPQTSSNDKALHPQIPPVLAKKCTTYGNDTIENRFLGNQSNLDRKVTIENRILCKDVLLNSRAAVSSTPVVKHSTSSRRLKLSLNLEYQSNVSTGTRSRPDGFSPAGFKSKRAFGNQQDLFGEPDSPLFDPELVASYEKALEDFSEDDWNSVHANGEPHRKSCDSDVTDAAKGLSAREPAIQVSGIVERGINEASSVCRNPWATEEDWKLYDPFERFEVKCPPGGEKTVVLYTTTLRGIRKTFEDCNVVREILQSFGLSIDERDVSMHLEFLNELRKLMGRVVSVPRVFIKGRYIGGVEEVAKFHENRELSELVQGLPKELHGGSCDGCGGVRFVPCLECSGSCKIVNEDSKVLRCPDCNENGLIQCPICS